MWKINIPRYQWLEEMAKSITISVPEASTDTVFCFCRLFLHAALILIEGLGAKYHPALAKLAGILSWL